MSNLPFTKFHTLSDKLMEVDSPVDSFNTAENISGHRKEPMIGRQQSQSMLNCLHKRTLSHVYSYKYLIFRSGSYKLHQIVM